jgi:hypothetical protein
MPKIVTYGGKRYVALADIEKVVKNADEWDVLSDYEHTIEEEIILDGKTLSQMVCLDALEDSFETNGETLEYRKGYTPKLASEQQENQDSEPADYEPEKPYQEQKPDTLEKELKDIEDGKEEDITAALAEEDEETSESEGAQIDEGSPTTKKKKRYKRRGTKSYSENGGNNLQIKAAHMRQKYSKFKDELRGAFDKKMLPFELLEEISDEYGDEAATELSDLIFALGGEIDYESDI